MAAELLAVAAAARIYKLACRWLAKTSPTVSELCEGSTGGGTQVQTLERAVSIVQADDVAAAKSEHLHQLKQDLMQYTAPGCTLPALTDIAADPQLASAVRVAALDAMQALSPYCDVQGYTLATDCLSLMLLRARTSELRTAPTQRRDDQHAGADHAGCQILARPGGCPGSAPAADCPPEDMPTSLLAATPEPSAAPSSPPERSPACSVPVHCALLAVSAAVTSTARFEGLLQDTCLHIEHVLSAGGLVHERPADLAAPASGVRSVYCLPVQHAAGAALVSLLDSDVTTDVLVGSLPAGLLSTVWSCRMPAMPCWGTEQHCHVWPTKLLPR